MLALACQVKLIDNIISPWDLFSWNLPYFLVKSVLLQFTLFCRETCFVAIFALSVWRQPTAKMLSVEKKWQISCMILLSKQTAGQLLSQIQSNTCTFTSFKSNIKQFHNHIWRWFRLVQSKAKNLAFASFFHPYI